MKSIIIALSAGSSLLFAAVLTGPQVSAGEVQLQSLRGAAAMEQTTSAPDIAEPATGERFSRAFLQQPPLIPHDIEGFRVDLRANDCLTCHDRPNFADAGAPKISDTHYMDRDGKPLDRLSGSHWFCAQCHVPQTRTSGLVSNEFKAAPELE